VVVWQNIFVLSTEPLGDLHGLIESPLTDPMNVTNSQMSLIFLSEPPNCINETYRVSLRTQGSRGIKLGNYVIGWYEK
jgi:hypothetical protein